MSKLIIIAIAALNSLNFHPVDTAWRLVEQLQSFTLNICDQADPGDEDHYE